MVWQWLHMVGWFDLLYFILRIAQEILCTDCPGHFLSFWCRAIFTFDGFFVKVTLVMLVTTGSENDRFIDLQKLQN